MRGVLQSRRRKLDYTNKEDRRLRMETAINIPKDWKMRDIFKDVVLNEYGYYELREKNVQEER